MSGERIFISYQRDSAEVAGRLRDALTAAGFETWLDTEQIRHTARWPLAIDHALRDADRLVVLLTEPAMASAEVFNEWFYFYQHRKPLHLIRLDDCDPHYQLLPFQRLEWNATPPRPWDERIAQLVRELRAPFTWPDRDSAVIHLVTSPFAPSRSLPGALAALEHAVRDPDRAVVLSEEQLHEIRAHKPRQLREYLLACYARWCAPQYQLDRRFVRLTLVVDEGTDTADRWTAYPSTRSSDDLREVLRASGAFAHVLLGAPGSGKSTLLRRLEMDVARSGIENPANPVVPFSVSLAEYGLSATEPPPDPLHWLSRRWSTRHPALPSLPELLAEGRVLLLLDGLNELAHSDPSDLRRRVDAWRAFLYEHVRDIPGNQALFTCRTLDYGAMLSSKDVGVPHIRLEPMTRDQVFEYLRLRLPEQADLVQQALSRDPRALSLYRNPYMLRLLINRVQAVGTVPIGRTEAFAGMVRELLRREILSGNQHLHDPELLTERERRLLRDGVTDPTWLPDRGHFIPALTRLAYQMQQAKRGEEKGAVVVDYDTAVELLNGLARLADSSLRAGTDTGILDDDEEAIRFFHQLLQEFFAARQLAAVPDPQRITVEFRASAVQPSLEQVLADLAPGEPLPPLATTGWEETAVMAAALTPDPDGYVLQLLAANPALAGRCLAAPDVRLTTSTRRQVTQGLMDHLADPGVDLRARLQLGRILATVDDPRYTRLTSSHGQALLPQFATIEAGRYRVGANDSPYPLEQPVHEVELTRFELARWPVTNAEYSYFIDAGGYQDDRWWHSTHARNWRAGHGTLDLISREWAKKRDSLRRRPHLPVRMLRDGTTTLHHAVSMVKLAAMSDREIRDALGLIYGTGAPGAPAYWHDSRLADPSHPVVGVSVYEAEAYCAWLTAVTGSRIRLASENEWEAVAAPDGRVFSYGDTFDTYAANTFELHLRTTSPVGVFPTGVSAHGCHDLTGNVFEWTASPATPYPHDPAARGSDAPEAVRICRGGSWRHHQIRARAAYRGRGQCFVRNDDLSFRLARG
ncbi:formylglycine-generating enzyme required for sulfatase activity [Kitasatospora sp. MAP12-15]|uniref:SUMF1/EgtB/PvdO family nonheme iron enzyme n=1 Tax=unclassified Kitasatospora TaxID=2633591 RepID=UPI002473C067|nr:SUMF1/EgtB/PvdO family nonheme iron enzyme [Kitasatospora sp. MAP12-44]MDH6114323.1 formylglycine-generating enzyme required for sulfatase activity [Kitasatospora sp. MAP12-44]